jgi:hypothetical protein
LLALQEVLLEVLLVTQHLVELEVTEFHGLINLNILFSLVVVLVVDLLMVQLAGVVETEDLAVVAVEVALDVHLPVHVAEVAVAEMV